MDRREFLKRSAALLTMLSLPVSVVRHPARHVLPAPHRYGLHGLPLSAWSLGLSADAESRGEAWLRRGANPLSLLHLTVGRYGHLHWQAQPGSEIIWTPDLRLQVSGDGVLAALPFQDRLLLASDAGQRWLPLHFEEI